MLQVLFILTVPFGILYISKKNRILRLLSPVLLSYLVGIFIGNMGFTLEENISMQISEIAVPVAIPFILYSVDIEKWLKMANRTIRSFILVMISAIAGSVFTALILRHTVDEYSKVSGMLAGCYTGGTPNLIAVGMATRIDQNLLVLVNGADIIVGGVYFLFIIGLAPRLTKLFLPPFQKQMEKGVVSVTDGNEVKISIQDVLISFAVMLLIVGISAGVSLMILRELNIAVFLLVLTALSIGASTIKRIREIPNTYSIGLYFILVFSVAMGSMVNFKTIFTLSSINILIYTLVVVFTAMLFHFLLAALFRIDRDTAIITSVAGIFGPAFIPSVAEAIKNREVILAGITSGLVGYAAGNYIGLSVVWIINTVF